MGRTCRRGRGSSRRGRARGGGCRWTARRRCCRRTRTCPCSRARWPKLRGGLTSDASLPFLILQRFVNRTLIAFRFFRLAVAQLTARLPLGGGLVAALLFRFHSGHGSLPFPDVQSTC